MHQRSLTASIRHARILRYVLVQGVLMALLFGASLAGVFLRLPGHSTAVWWPAAAVAVVAVLAARGRRVLIAVLVLVVSGVANWVGGTDPIVSLGFGLANAGEAWAVATIALMRRRPGVELELRDTLRFLLAAVIGAVVAGVVAGATVALLAGGSWLMTAPSVAASHLSAVILLVPIALVPRRSFLPPHPLELVVQLATLVVVVTFAFFPGQVLPLAYLPFPVLAWAAFRFGTGVVVAEVLATTLLAGVLITNGGGPFGSAFAPIAPELQAPMSQLYLITMAASMLVFAGLHEERRELLARHQAREALLRGGIIRASAGFMIVDEDERGRLRVLEANPTARETFLGWEHGAPEFAFYLPREGALADGLAVVMGRDESEWRGEIEIADGRRLEVQVVRIDRPGFPSVVVIQSLDLTERVLAEEALARALQNEQLSADRLRELNRQKDDFVSSVSHELRTPITSILGYAELLEDEARLTRRDRGYLEVVMRNARRLGSLVEDLLHISEMSATRPLATAHTFDAADLIDTAVGELRLTAAQQGVDLTVDLPVRPLELTGSRSDLDRIVANLVTNALKFTPRGGSVTVSAHPEADGIRLTVVDTGRGIAPDELDRVFERFYRSASTGADAVAGTGLGLPIVRSLAERVGGTVWLESDGSTGTTAVAILPHAAPLEPASV